MSREPTAEANRLRLSMRLVKGGKFGQVVTERERALRVLFGGLGKPPPKLDRERVLDEMRKRGVLV